MVSFRKSLLLVALVAIVASMALAQTTVQCSVALGAPQAILRAESLSELLPVVNLVCTSTNPAGLPTVLAGGTPYNVTFFAPNITSSPDVDGNGTPEVQLNGVAASTITAQSVSFSNVNLAPFGVGVAPTTLTTTMALTGLRVNANALGSGNGFGAGVTVTALLQPVTAGFSPAVFASGNPAVANTAQIGSVANVAYAVNTLSFKSTASNNLATPGQYDSNNDIIKLSQCGYPFSGGFDATKGLQTDPTKPNAPLFTVAFSESYSGGFKPTTDANLPASVDQKLRVAFTINNVPSGVTFYTQPVVQVNIGTVALPVYINFNLIAGADANGNGGNIAYTSTKWYPATGLVVYELDATTPAPNSTFMISIPVVGSFTGVPALTGSTPVTITGSYAPLSTVTTPASNPIPRFAAASTLTAGETATLTNCSSSITFPYVITGNGGWDTGIAIANLGATVSHPTAGTPGTCTITFFGPSAPAAYTTPDPVAPGTTAGVALSGPAAKGDFAGYAIATCEYPQGDLAGFTYITNTKTGATGAYIK